MKLEVYKDEFGRKMVRPYNPDSRQKALFEHCASGMIAVTEDYYDTVVDHLLGIHGVTLIDFIYDESKM